MRVVPSFHHMATMSSSESTSTLFTKWASPSDHSASALTGPDQHQYHRPHDRTSGISGFKSENHDSHYLP